MAIIVSIRTLLSQSTVIYNTRQSNFIIAISTQYRLHDSTIIWNNDIVHKCPYEYVQSGTFQIIDNVLIVRKQNLLFQLTSTTTACDMNVFTTAEGLFLTYDSKALNLTKAINDIKIIDLILAEQDFYKEDLYSSFASSYQKTKFCYLYSSIITLFSKMNDQFIIFHGFY